LNSGYAIPECDDSQRYFAFFLYFVFALCKRKNEIQNVEPVLELVGGLLEQRLERRLLERLGGLGVVEHLLKSRIHALGLADLGN
jgi:hypothetical protein